MKKLETIEDITPFTGSIIAYSTASKYYADRKNTLDNGLNPKLVFAMVGSTMTSWGDKDFGLSMQTFGKVTPLSTKCFFSDLPLTPKSFEENGYLNVRLATAKEVNKLKELVESNKVVLGYTQREETIKTLTDYLSNKISPIEVEEIKILGITTES